MLQLIKTVVGGFLMGTADLVPGVSGGTVALVLGIYERLVASIRHGSSALGALLRRDVKAATDNLRSVEWRFLIPLLLGVFAAIVGLAGLIETLLHERPLVMAGAFFGLVVGSIVIAWSLIDSPRLPHGATALVVGAALFLLLGLGGDFVVTAPALPVFFGAGALAICAMILPGISGSLILLLVGMYAPVLSAVNDRSFLEIVVFALGAVVGLALFSQGLHWALRRHHDMVLAGLVGLMIGSLRVVWPWPGGVDSAALDPPGEALGAVVVWAIAGFAAVFVIARLARSREEMVSETLSA